MGLKTSNYDVKDIGITLPTAYAQITHLSIDLDGVASVTFAIQQSRDMITANEAIETKYFKCFVDKQKPIYAQIYVNAKNMIFQEWEDDIVESGVDA